MCDMFHPHPHQYPVPTANGDCRNNLGNVEVNESANERIGATSSHRLSEAAPQGGTAPLPHEHAAGQGVAGEAAEDADAKAEAEALSRRRPSDPRHLAP